MTEQERAEPTRGGIHHFYRSIPIEVISNSQTRAIALRIDQGARGDTEVSLSTSEAQDLVTALQEAIAVLADR